MKTMKRILTAALVAATLAGGLGAGSEAANVRGCKPEIHPTSNEIAGDWTRRPEPRLTRPAVAAVRG